MRQVLRVGALGRPRGMGWGGKWEGGSGWGAHVNPWLIHVIVWQKPLQYCKVTRLQLIKINEKKKGQGLSLSLSLSLCPAQALSFSVSLSLSLSLFSLRLLGQHAPMPRGGIFLYYLNKTERAITLSKSCDSPRSLIFITSNFC